MKGNIMRNKARKMALIFLATVSVYSGPVGLPVSIAWAADPVSPGANRARTTLPASNPSTDPFGADGKNDPATVVDAPSSGKSVSADDVTYNAEVGTVEIHVNDAELVEVLRMLSLQSRKNIVASKEVKGTITANLYGVTVREALDAILHANGYAYREEGNFIYVYTQQELDAREQAKRVRKTEVFRLNYSPAQDVVKVLRQVLGEGARIEQMAPAHTVLCRNGTTT